MGFRSRTIAALALCLAHFVLIGCSGDDGAGEVEVGGGRGPTGSSGEDGGLVTIEMAYLSSAGDADIVNARVRFAGEAVWPECFLIEGPTAEAIERAEQGGGLYRGRVDSTWASPDTTDKRLEKDDTVVVSFHKAPGSEAPDPDRTPYFVFCAGGEGPSGSDRAHVEGTPET